MIDEYGFEMGYVEGVDPPPEPVAQKKGCRPFVHNWLRTQRRVRCVDTGEIFESISCASRSVKRSNVALRNAILGHRRCAGAYWEFVDAE